MPDDRVDIRVTLTLKLDPRLVARIDEAAARDGQNRTQYVLSWLPAYYEWQEGDGPADTTRRIDEAALARAKWAAERLRSRTHGESEPPVVAPWVTPSGRTAAGR
jgi:hypothetical protein